MALEPLQSPDAVQLVAFVDVHVSVDVPPDATLPGDAVSVTVGAAPIVTVAVFAVDPPAPSQVSVYAVVTVNALVTSLPLVAFVPLQPPDAVQLVAFVDVHVRVDVSPDAMLPGDAVSVTVGAGATVTVALCDVEPPAPVQFNVNVEVAVNGPVLWFPVVDLLPDQPPDATQLVALAAFHVNVDAVPDATVVGAAVNVSVGAGAIVTVAVCAAEPPTPVHVNVKLDGAVKIPVLCVPDVPLLPDQLPDATQLVALAEFHVNVDAAPDATLPGDAVSVSVGAGTTVTVAVCETEPPVPVQFNV